MPRLAFAFVAALFVGLCAARAARADDKATRDAHRHFETAEKLFALGRFDAALTEYEAAYEAKPLAGFLFNIGQCHRNLGDYDAAIFSFKKYLEEEPDAPNKDDVQALITDLEQKKADADAERQRHQFDQPPPVHHARSKPIYEKWWFWGGVAAVAGAGTGTYLLLSGGVPDTDLGNIVFR
jgi:tetratricopeptide (TPR) repeat protein